MKTSVKRRVLSVFLAVLMAVGCLTPGISALADGVIGVYDLKIFYEDGTIVPDYDDDENKVEHVEYMTEGDKVTFTYQTPDCTVPDNGYVKWTSDTPTVCDVVQEGENGLVRAFDSSKGAAVHLWLDNEVAAVPVVGKLLKAALEKVLFNDKVDLDTMDTDAIVALVEGAFGSDSPLSKYFESYKGELIDSLCKYLDKVNTVISCTMYDKDGNVLAEDHFRVCVQKSEEIYADFLPNGTHITNKQDLPTTVAKGTTLQLSACTTPTRLHMGVIYSVKNSSLFSSGKVIATVDDSGLVTFKNTGTVTIMVSPDTDGFIQNLLKYVNYIYPLQHTGTIDTGKIADVLIKYVGLDINRNVLMGILDACFAIADIVGDSADAVQLTATAVKIIANLILQFTTNDSITFEVVDGVPVTDFEVTGASSVKEGDQLALGIDNVKPVAADTSDIVWTSSDPSIASVDEKTGMVLGRDAGGSLGSLSKQTVTITATSTANNVSKSVEITVTGKTGSYVSDVDILADSNSVNIGESEVLNAQVYPARMQSSNLLHIYWGVVTGGTSKDDYEYTWATDPYDEVDENGDPVLDENGNTVVNDGLATDGIGKIDKLGQYTALAGGTCLVACRAVTGYKLSDSNFYTISEVITVMPIVNGLPIESISLSATGVDNTVSISPKLTTKDVEVNGTVYHYATIDYSGSAAGLGCKVQANILPAEATNKNLVWHLEGSNDYSIAKQDNGAGTAVVQMKAGVEKATSVNVYATSEDGKVVSDMITVVISKNQVKSNSIDTDNLEIIRGKTANATHTVEFNGSLTSGAFACKEANWYSADTDVCTVESVDSNGNAVIRGVDVGVTTLYCVSADGAFVDSCQVTVYPDKSNLSEILELCKKTKIRRTADNAADYKTYMRELDYAYYIMEASTLCSQTTVDDHCRDLLYIFYKLGGYVTVNGVTILDKDGNKAPNYVSVPVKTTIPYTKASYNLGYELNPKNAMYKTVRWTSSDSSISVTNNGLCKPTSNKACSSTITVTVTDYLGNVYKDSVVITFVNTQATGVTINPDTVTGGKVGETVTLQAKVTPTNIFGNSDASISNVVWASSDESVATVDDKGVVTFVYGGDCEITATTVDGGYVGTCKVNVVTNYTPLIEAINKYNGLSLSAENYYPDTYKAYTDAIAEAQAMVDANASTQKEVNAMIVKLDEAYKGLKKYTYISKVEIYQDGEATSDYYQYDVSIWSDGIRFTNVKFALNVRLYPNNASYESVLWESSNPEYISVDEDGNCSVLQNKAGTAVITCTVTDHFGHSWSDDVNVAVSKHPVTGVTLSDHEIIGAVGSTRKLAAEVTPKPTLGIGGAQIKDLVWTSDNEEVATVDSEGNVTFVSAGATTIRVTTLDGGFTDECAVSTEGDRKVLNAAVEKYKDVDYQDYDYEYGMQFKEAYENAVNALTDNTLTQSDINDAAQKLESAGEQLAGHEFQKAQTVNIAYENQYHTAGVRWTSKGTGTIDAAADAYSYKGESKINNSRVILTASLDDAVANNYTNVEWQVVDKSSNSEVSISDKQITINASRASNSAKVTLKVTATDVYGRTVERTLRVVVSYTIVTGITLSDTAVTKPADEGAFKLNATISPGDASVQEIIWSSSNENVATVDGEGNVTPVNTGSCTITAETFDGGYKAICNVTLTTNFTALAQSYAKYKDFVDSVLEEHIYTSKSLSVLQQAVEDADAMIKAGTANQTEVNAMIAKLDDAFNNLVKFVPVTGAKITFEEQDKTTMVNDGYIRYQSTLGLSGASFLLGSESYPADAACDDVVWTSSNPDAVSVSANGVVSKAANSNAATAIITATYTDEAGNTASDSVCVSFVRTAATGISFSSEIVYGRPNSTTTLSPSISSASKLVQPDIKNCVYKSSNTDIATVDENGVVTFVSYGEAEITATTMDGGYSATIKVFTTCDTSALLAIIDKSKNVEYTDYAYAYGTAFKQAYDNAVEVSNNYRATQEEINTATTELTTAYNNLAGNEFIGTGDIKLVANGAELSNGSKVPVGDDNTVTITASYNENAMLKSAQFSFENANGVEASVQDGKLVITKTTTESSGSVDVIFTTVDDYDREISVMKSITVVDKILPISDFKFTYNGEEVESVTHKSTFLSNQSVQLGINIYPENAEDYKSVTWTSNNTKITVDSNGLVKTGSAMGLVSSAKTVITCTVTCQDGTTIEKEITVTFTR